MCTVWMGVRMTHSSGRENHMSKVHPGTGAAVPGEDQDLNGRLWPL